MIMTFEEVQYSDYCHESPRTLNRAIVIFLLLDDLISPAYTYVEIFVVSLVIRNE